MTISTYLAYFLSVLFMLVLPTILFLVIKNNRILKTITSILLIIFVIILFVLVWFRTSISTSVITVNADFSNNWFSNQPKILSHSIKDYIINILMLFPLGFAISVLRENKKHTIILSAVCGLLLSLIIELGQYILPIYRSPELLDIILNTISATFGSLYCFILYKIKQKIYRNKKA